ncbi:unnamed protein product [Mycena citricolor]|uniref:Zn(2)-C6 fungal-type domain-containing protein n=1 Tax=Mycena citricolor TaxID=2018698 RepID=A0AAD2H0F6_9AGAR|nr:unnamed protein product [Mycena citricolor]
MAMNRSRMDELYAASDELFYKTFPAARPTPQSARVEAEHARMFAPHRMTTSSLAVSSTCPAPIATSPSSPYSAVHAPTQYAPQDPRFPHTFLPPPNPENPMFWGAQPSESTSPRVAPPLSILSPAQAPAASHQLLPRLALGNAGYASPNADYPTSTTSSFASPGAAFGSPTNHLASPNGVYPSPSSAEGTSPPPLSAASPFETIYSDPTVFGGKPLGAFVAERGGSLNYPYKAPQILASAPIAEVDMYPGIDVPPPMVFSHPSSSLIASALGMPRHQPRSLHPSSLLPSTSVRSHTDPLSVASSSSPSSPPDLSSSAKRKARERQPRRPPPEKRRNGHYPASPPRSVMLALAEEEGDGAPGEEPMPGSSKQRRSPSSPRRKDSTMAVASAAAAAAATGVEITSVKELQKKPPLACLFCRGRKIACGPSMPVPGKPDKFACNQCQRRALECTYPLESRRGMRKKKTDTEAEASGEQEGSKDSPPDSKESSASTSSAVSVTDIDVCISVPIGADSDDTVAAPGVLDGTDCVAEDGAAAAAEGFPDVGGLGLGYEFGLAMGDVAAHPFDVGTDGDDFAASLAATIGSSMDNSAFEIMHASTIKAVNVVPPTVKHHRTKDPRLNRALPLAALES